MYYIKVLEVNVQSGHVSNNRKETRGNGVKLMTENPKRTRQKTKQRNLLNVFCYILQLIIKFDSLTDARRRTLPFIIGFLYYRHLRLANCTIVPFLGHSASTRHTSLPIAIGLQ